MVEKDVLKLDSVCPEVEGCQGAIIQLEMMS